MVGDIPSDDHTDAVDALIDDRIGGWIEELRDYCRIPSETGEPEPLGQAARWTAERLRAAGCRVETLEIDGAPPLVVGEAGAGDQTLVCVQHYDVQPAAPLEDWQNPPYEPTVRDGRLYARGVSDNKGHFLSRVHGLEAVRDALGDLPMRVRFLVEGEEESGSAHLADFLKARPELMSGDAALIEGGGTDDADRPVLWCGVRGMVYVELVAHTLAVDSHSAFASLLPSAAWRLVEALSTLWRGDRIAIDGFYDRVRAPRPEELDALQSMPFDEAAYKRVFAVREFTGDRTGLDAATAQIFEPTCNISGVWSGWTGPGLKTVVPAEAHARLDLRLVPDQSPDDVEELLRNHLDARGFGDVDVRSTGWRIAPYFTPLADPLIERAARASEEVFGTDCVRLVALPGTAPMAQVCIANELPCVGIGFTTPDANVHAPNENVRLDLQENGTKTFARLLQQLNAT